MRTATHRRAARRAQGLAAVLLAVVAVLVGVPDASAAEEQPWKQAADLRRLLADAEKALIVDGPAVAARLVERAVPVARSLAGLLGGDAAESAARIEQGLEWVAGAVRADDGVALAAARAEVRCAVLEGAYLTVIASIETGDAARAEEWFLVREFRKPTRFSRPGADGTLALAGLARGKVAPQAALAVVRADLLDTYQARLRASLEAADEAVARGFATRAASETALAAGYGAILLEAYRAQHGTEAANELAAALHDLAGAGLAGDTVAYEAARTSVDQALSGFRAAPLSAGEEQRRAGQFVRFLALVPVEYGRGVEDGRVALDFEVQEAITFRDGAAQALGDLEPALAKRDPRATARIVELVNGLGSDLALAARGERVADPGDVETRTQEVLDLAEGVFPDAWKEAGSAADFDVIRTTLDRIQGALSAGEFGKAEQARLEAYAFFEFGPEQRLRGLAPDLFIRVEGLFWYGADGLPGLAQLVKRKADPQEISATREALDTALADAEAAVGSGPTSTFAVISNTAIIVFREGLEAVLILAALMAGMAGAEVRFRRPLLLGAGAALLATAATWAVAQTVLGSLSRYGEKLEAVVSLVAIAVLLLILNWFYHRVYWSEHLADLHGRKKRILRTAGLSLAAAQVAGLAALGFSSVYREGFETVLFVQALVLEAGAATVLEGVALGVVGVGAVAVLTLVLQRKLPHKRMLILTGVLILGVLVVMVGKTTQALQVVGWLPVTPVEGLHLPYWAGLWLGAFPTWEGLVAQAGSGAIVLGSYVAAERLRKRRRRRLLEAAAIEFGG